jgi:hypothetical protein
MMEISTTEHQPAGIIVNPYFAKTYELFFSQGYRFLTSDETVQEINQLYVQQVVAGTQKMVKHYFVYHNK